MESRSGASRAAGVCCVEQLKVSSANGATWPLLALMPLLLWWGYWRVFYYAIARYRPARQGGKEWFWNYDALKPGARCGAVGELLHTGKRDCPCSIVFWMDYYLIEWFEWCNPNMFTISEPPSHCWTWKGSGSLWWICSSAPWICP
jgi:hypothetical protein